jgi:hypothetical protein
MMQGFELQWNIAKSPVTAGFKPPVAGPDEQFRDFLKGTTSQYAGNRKLADLAPETELPN